MPPPEYRGPERRQFPTREEIAAVEDAKRLSSRRYRRHQRITVLTSVVSCLVIAGLVSYLIAGTLRDNAHYNSVQTCNTQAEARVTGNQRAFAQRQVLDVADAAFDQFPSRFKARVIAKINEEYARKRPLLGNGAAPPQITKFGDLKWFVALAALIDCDEQLR